jgi:hypothetical protein
LGLCLWHPLGSARVLISICLSPVITEILTVCEHECKSWEWEAEASGSQKQPLCFSWPNGFSWACDRAWKWRGPLAMSLLSQERVLTFWNCSLNNPAPGLTSVERLM